jgi:DNA-binding NtrC family response regulator
MRSRILVVDDEPSIRTVLKAHLSRDGYDVAIASDGAEAVSALTASPFDLVISDLKMPGMSGLELLAWCIREQPGLPVVLITAHGTVDTAVEALKLGAQDFITKPFDLEELRLTVIKALRVEQARRRNWLDADSYGTDTGRFDLVGRTASMKRVYGLVERVADSPSTVLLTGESGTGKELVARALHSQSSRKNGPFVTVNCGAIPETLFESELFGHEKGGFTGAVGRRAGVFEMADGGSLFLDELGETSLNVQVNLLRVLEEMRFRRVGGTEEVSVDVRIIAATNVDLETAVTDKRFREDLFYRLNVFPVTLPPLRERPEDIPILTRHFLMDAAKEYELEPPTASPEAMDVILRYRWPGNVRQLRALCERWVIQCAGRELGVEDLPGELSVRGRPTASPVGAFVTDDITLPQAIDRVVEQVERAYLDKLLSRHRGHLIQTAASAGITRRTLFTRMKALGLDAADYK